MKKRPRPLSLREVVALLRTFSPPPERPPTSDPFDLVLWENIAYLASPARRLLAFEKLRESVGTRPEQILAARQKELESVTAFGVLRKGTAAKIRECARVALREFDGDLRPVLRQPVTTAVRRLQDFPSIGKPGAERVLLFAGRPAGLAPESNALRVLERVGLVPPARGYARMYQAARELSLGARAVPKRYQEAHLLLQVHGRTLCRRAAPKCSPCPLVDVCAYALRHGAGQRRSS
jgi:endonuclease III